MSQVLAVDDGTAAQGLGIRSVGSPANRRLISPLVVRTNSNQITWE